MQFGNIKKIALIGGGEPMVHCARTLKNANIDVHGILAPRHEDSELPLSGEILGEALKTSDIPYICVEEINDADFINSLEGFDMALCFGPAWIFGKKLREAFKNQMLNFNGIPIPRYLGGAHYTWQILNGDKTSGMAIQHITDKVDLGDILMYEEQPLPNDVRIPQDYFEHNYKIACTFLDKFVSKLLIGEDFPATAYETLQSRRLYFPRLLTLEQAFIDWSWSGADIEKFCCGFDQPYPGASTYVKDERVFVKAVKLEETDNPTHPFCSGLVIRKYDNVLYVAVTGGVLSIRTLLDGDSKDMIPSIREGDQLNTPREKTDYAKAYRPKIGSKKTS